MKLSTWHQKGADISPLLDLPLLEAVNRGVLHSSTQCFVDAGAAFSPARTSLEAELCNNCWDWDLTGPAEEAANLGSELDFAENCLSHALDAGILSRGFPWLAEAVVRLPRRHPSVSVWATRQYERVVEGYLTAHGNQSRELYQAALRERLGEAPCTEVEGLLFLSCWEGQRTLERVPDAALELLAAHWDFSWEVPGVVFRAPWGLVGHLGAALEEVALNPDLVSWVRLEDCDTPEIFETAARLMCSVDPEEVSTFSNIEQTLRAARAL